MANGEHNNVRFVACYLFFRRGLECVAFLLYVCRLSFAPMRLARTHARTRSEIVNHIIQRLFDAPNRSIQQ